MKEFINCQINECKKDNLIFSNKTFCEKIYGCDYPDVIFDLYRNAQ